MDDLIYKATHTIEFSWTVILPVRHFLNYFNK